MIQKLCDERLVKKILLIFLAIQPVLDCYLLYTDEVRNFFHFSPTTILRILIIAFLLFAVFVNKNNKGNRKIIYIYGFLILVYSILHFIVTSGVDNSGYKTFSYNFMDELFYIIRMSMPLAIIFITYSIKPTKEEIIKLFLIVSAITSSVIVVSNLLVFSLASYGGGVIKGNVFDWFFGSGYQMHDLASKGWFNSANQISGLMYILFPICVYSLFEKLTKSRIIITLMCLISMIMLGTRVAVYGCILLLILMIVVYLLSAFLFRTITFEKKKLFSLFGLVLVASLLFTHAPLVSTNSTYTKKDDEEMIKIRSEKNVSTEMMLKYIGMNGIYYKRIYPYKEHKEFWENVVDNVPAEQRVGNRNSQTLITHDVGATYENAYRSVFGLGYSRFISAYLYLEKDFIVHFYTIGILGILLFLCPYILIALFTVVKMFKYRDFSPFVITLLFSMLLPLGVSYFSGHIVDELIVSLYLGLIAGYLLYNPRKENKNGKS